MIYPTNTGKSGEHLRLATLESVWIQGKLRMWGRWSYIGGGRGGKMIKHLYRCRYRHVYWRWQVRKYVQSVVGIQKIDENSHQ